MIEPPVVTDEQLPGVRQLPRVLTPFAIPAYRRMALALTCGAFAYGVWTVALVWEVIRLGGGPAQLSMSRRRARSASCSRRSWPGSWPTGCRRSWS